MTLQLATERRTRKICEKADECICLQGFGFVTFLDVGDAERAKKELHGKIVDGRKIEARVQTHAHFSDYGKLELRTRTNWNIVHCSRAKVNEAFEKQYTKNAERQNRAAALLARQLLSSPAESFKVPSELLRLSSAFKIPGARLPTHFCSNTQWYNNN